MRKGAREEQLRREKELARTRTAAIAEQTRRPAAEERKRRTQEYMRKTVVEAALTRQVRAATNEDQLAVRVKTFEEH